MWLQKLRWINFLFVRDIRRGNFIGELIEEIKGGKCWVIECYTGMLQLFAILLLLGFDDRVSCRISSMSLFWLFCDLSDYCWIPFVIKEMVRRPDCRKREKASRQFLIVLSQPGFHQGGRIFFDVEFFYEEMVKSLWVRRRVVLWICVVGEKEIQNFGFGESVLPGMKKRMSSRLWKSWV